MSCDDDRSEGDIDYAPEHYDHEATKMTCDVLCSLSSSNRYSCDYSGSDRTADSEGGARRKQNKSSTKACPKQLQLPLFLSKTYHMIDRCDADIATWSESGDNFVVKNVEKFASDVLPLYFKHSNFSSFARQLNFYGFRKLRSEAILTSDVDPRTSEYVRFYHEHFQKGRPELLHNIKRATKSDQHSKDDVDSLKMEVACLKEELVSSRTEYNRKIAELSYECNRRITSMNAEYDKLALFVHQSLGSATSANSSSSAPQAQGRIQHAAQGAPAASETKAAPVAAAPRTTSSSPNTGMQVDLLHSLSQAAAMTLQNHRFPPTASQRNASPTSAGANSAAAGGAGMKRAASYNSGDYDFYSGKKKMNEMTNGKM